jgi:Flp pilus assembly protein TadG
MIVAATRGCKSTPSARARQKRRHGVAAVELAILLPLLGFLFVIALDYSRIFYFTMVVTNCARSGAIYGSQNPTTSIRAFDEIPLVPLAVRPTWIPAT